MTDAPSEYGGQARSFSATDLLAAALGTCIATSIDSVALRHRIPLQAIEIEVQKKLADRPKRVTGLAVFIQLAHDTTPEVLQRMRRAAETCVVKRSLHPDIAVQIDFISRQHLE